MDLATSKRLLIAYSAMIAAGGATLVLLPTDRSPPVPESKPLTAFETLEYRCKEEFLGNDNLQSRCVAENVLRREFEDQRERIERAGRGY